MKNLEFNVETGGIVLMIKNEDGTFSPLAIDKNQAYIVSQFLGGLSENAPLVRMDMKFKEECLSQKQK